MTEQDSTSAPTLLDVIVEVVGEKVIVEVDIRNNDTVRIGDQYTFAWDDGAVTVMRVTGFRSAAEYCNTSARRTEAMREGVVGEPDTLTARKAYQTKLAELRIEGELYADGSRRIGPSRTPNVMVPVRRISDESLERFATHSDGNLVLGHLRSGSRMLGRPARIRHNYAGERMFISGMPGKGKTQAVRAMLSQEMAQE